MVGCVRNMNSLKFQARAIKCRNYARYDKETFNKDLQSASWVSVLSRSDVNLAWASFKNIFLQICDRHVPLLTKKVRVSQNPWMTSAISNLMSTRDYYLRKAKRSGRDEDWSSYRSYRNQVTAAVRNAKSDYNRNLIQESLDNPRNFWKYMKKILPDKSSNLDSINQLKCDGQAIMDKESIANQFSKYFSEINLRISDGFKRSSVAWPICSKSSSDKFYMAPVTKQEQEHVTRLVNKVSRQPGLLSRVRNSLTVHAAERVFTTIIVLKLDYCDFVWHNLAPSRCKT